MNTVPCPCGCGKTVDVENVKAGRPFALRSCAKVFRRKCEADATPADALLKVWRDCIQVDTRNKVYFYFKTETDNPRVMDLEGETITLPDWFNEVLNRYRADNLAMA